MVSKLWPHSVQNGAAVMEARVYIQASKDKGKCGKE